ncbi:hypothetical protein ACFL4O_00450 [bacterium]
MKIRVSLGIKIFFVSLITFVLLFCVTGFYYLLSFKADLNDSLIDKARLIAKINKPIMVQDIINYNDIGLLSKLERMESIENLSYAHIVDTKGKVIGHSDVYEIGNTYEDDITKWAVGVKDFAFKKIVKNNEPLFICSAPFQDPELGIVAFLVMGLPRSAINKQVLLERKRFSLFALGFTAVFLIIFMIVFMLKILIPLKLIRDGIKLMATNLNQFKFTIKSSDEIGDIYKNVNDLIAGMSNNMGSLQGTKDELLKEEENRLEEILSIIHEKSFFVITDEDNKVVYSNIPKEMFEQEISGNHIMDVFKETDVIQFITDAYSNKGRLIKGQTQLKDKKYDVEAFVVKAKATLKDKTVLIFREI